MGVYLFQHRRAPFIKVGSYVCRGKRVLDNPWYRIANRGYHSIRHPSELSGTELDADAFDLLAWFPNLQRKDETLIHKHFKDRIGEFHAAVHEKELIAYCEELGGIAEEVPTEAKVAAWNWAGRSNIDPAAKSSRISQVALPTHIGTHNIAKSRNSTKRKLTSISPT